MKRLQTSGETVEGDKCANWHVWRKLSTWILERRSACELYLPGTKTNVTYRLSFAENQKPVKPPYRQKTDYQ